MTEWDAWFGPVDEDVALDWRSLPNEDDDEDELLALTDPEVKALLGFDPAVADVEKVYDPNQPRDEEGRWASVRGPVPYGELPDVPEIGVLHGTAKAHLDSILKEGITVQPAARRNFDDLSSSNVLYRGERGEAVYVASDYETALFYARTAARKSGSEPVVLEIKMPTQEWREWRDDNIQPGGHFAPRRTIKPEWIVGARMRGESYGGGSPLDSFNWVPVPGVNLPAAKADTVTFYMVLDLNEGVEKFDPNQPRDERGRWTDTGGAGPFVLPLSQAGYVDLDDPTIAEEVARFRAQGYATVFHGTQAQFLDSIKERGLTSERWSQGVGNDEWDITVESTPSPLQANRGTLAPVLQQQRISVYVATDLNRAVRYSRLVTTLSGGKPVVFMARVPIDEWARNSVSQRHDDPNWDRGYRYRGTIKPEWIVGAIDVTKVMTIPVYFVVAVDGVDTAKAFDPNQPRDEEGKWTTAWHGSGSDILDSVRREGLKLGLSNEVWLALRIERALTYARLGGGDAIIFEVQVPNERLAEMRMFRPNAMASPFVIPPSWIKGYMTLNRDTSEIGSLTPLAKAGTTIVYVVMRLPSVEKFDPNQPRDEEGKWTETGAASGAPLTVEQTQLGVMRHHLGQELTDDQRADIAISGMYHTHVPGQFEYYQLEDLRRELGGPDRYESLEAAKPKLDTMSARVAAMSDAELRTVIESKLPNAFTGKLDYSDRPAHLSTYEFADNLGVAQQNRVADALIDVYNNHPDLLQAKHNLISQADGLLNYGTGTWRGDVLDRVADNIDLSKVSKYNHINMYAKDYNKFLPTFVQSWTIKGGTDAYRRSYVALEDFGPNAGNRLWMGPEKSEGWGIKALSEHERVPSANLRANLEKLYNNTQAFYQAKFATQRNPTPDLSAKVLRVKRGVGKHFDSYTPAPVESWTVDAYTPARFGKELTKMMADNKGRWSIITATTDYSKVFMSYESLKGTWPEEKDLKGKKEMVVLGSGLTNLEVQRN